MTAAQMIANFAIVGLPTNRNDCAHFLKAAGGAAIDP